METKPNAIEEICKKIGQCSAMIVEYENSIRSLQDNGEDEMADHFGDLEVSVLGQLQELTILLTGAVGKKDGRPEETDQSDYTPTDEYEDELGEMGT